MGIIKHKQKQQIQQQQQQQHQFKIILPVKEEWQVNFTIELLTHSCQHMIEAYDKDIKRHRQNLQSCEDKDLKEAIQTHIDGCLKLVAYYQELKAKLKNKTSVVVGVNN